MCYKENTQNISLESHYPYILYELAVLKRADLLSHCIRSRLTCCKAPMDNDATSLFTSCCVRQAAMCLHADMHVVCATFSWKFKIYGYILSTIEGIYVIINENTRTFHTADKLLTGRFVKDWNVDRRNKIIDVIWSLACPFASGIVQS